MQQSHQKILAGVVLAFVAASAGIAKPPPGGGQNSASPSGATTANQSNASSAAGATPSPQSAAASTASFESQILAYEAIDQIAKQVATKVCGVFSAKSDADRLKNIVVIYDQNAFATTMSYSAFAQNAAALVGAYGTLAPTDKDQEAGSGKTGTAASGSGSSISYSPVSDLTGLLQALAVSANTETYGTVAIPDAAVAVAITREMAQLASCNKLPIVYPPLFGQGSYSNLAAKNIQEAVDSVNVARRTAHNRVTAAQATGTSVGSPTASLSYFATELADVDGLYDSFINSLLQPNSSTGILGSATVVQGKALADLLAVDPGKHDPAYVLLATVVAAGGTIHDHKSFWTALTTGDKISFSGGAVVAVSMWQASANTNVISPAPVYADIIHLRTDFRKSSQIQ
jgi:hypothetical protein